MYFDPRQNARVFEGYFKAYWKGVDSMIRASQPAMKAAARAQIEAGGFVTKRMKANFELPTRLGRCRNPVEAMQEGAQFWVECMEDYAQTSQRAMQILGVRSPQPLSRIDDWVPRTQEPNIRERERDVMTVEPKVAKAGRREARADQVAA